jgi:ribose transport system permease protein
MNTVSRTSDALSRSATSASAPDQSVTDDVGNADQLVVPVTDRAMPDRWGWARSLSSKYALIGVWLAMSGVYLAIMPDKFGRASSVQAIFGSQQVLVFLAMAALSTLIVGEFDLSVASVMGLAATIIPVLSGVHGMNLWLACLIALFCAACCGAVNAFFIVGLGVPSLVVTLGSGTFFLGIAELVSHSSTVSISSVPFSKIVLYDIAGMPVSFYYGLLLVAAFAYICAWTPLGRHVLFVGANREVARLAGIRVSLIRSSSYIVAGVLAGLAAIVLIASTGGFDPSGAANYLLPTLAAVFLSTAVVQPGQFNAIGTIVGIYFLETGIFGLQLRGLSGWIQDVFYGGGLVFAVALATIVRQRSKTA